MDLIGKKMCENQCLIYFDCKVINFNKCYFFCEFLNCFVQEVLEYFYFEEGIVYIYNIMKSQVMICFIFICCKESDFQILLIIIFFFNLEIFYL